MPLYSFRCADGHEVEAIARSGTIERQCECGLTAVKRSVYAIANQHATVRHEGKDFIEASEQVEHPFAEFEKREGVPVERPALWSAAKQQAGITDFQ